MNLTQITLAKINALGFDAAAEYFGVKPATVRNWANSKKVPASAAQKVMDELGMQPTTEMPQERSTLTAITPERIAGIELRLAILESKVAPSTGIAVVPPQAQPNWTAPHNFRK